MLRAFANYLLIPQSALVPTDFNKILGQGIVKRRVVSTELQRPVGAPVHHPQSLGLRCKLEPTWLPTGSHYTGQ